MPLKNVFRPVKYFRIGIVAILFIVPIFVFLYVDHHLQKLNLPVSEWSNDPFFKLPKDRNSKNWVKLSGFSKNLIHAVVVQEDWAFYQHEGIDLTQLKLVTLQALEEGRFSRGASTITQQVVKNLILSPERTLTRKAKELILTWWLEKKISKNTILEIYLNIAQWGKDFYGAPKACQVYFDKKCSEITLREGAFLAMLLPNPATYSSSFYRKELSPYAKETIDAILEKLKVFSNLSQETIEMEKNQTFPFETKNQMEDTYGNSATE